MCGILTWCVHACVCRLCVFLYIYMFARPYVSAALNRSYLNLVDYFTRHKTLHGLCMCMHAIRACALVITPRACLHSRILRILTKFGRNILRVTTYTPCYTYSSCDVHVHCSTDPFQIRCENSSDHQMCMVY
jgi:hypothetical protein